LANKLSDDDKDTIKDAMKDTQDWLDKNQTAEKEDYEEELKELEK
jgi:endoplasmic reticulum chaperone BiP